MLYLDQEFNERNENEKKVNDSIVPNDKIVVISCIGPRAIHIFLKKQLYWADNRTHLISTYLFIEKTDWNW